MPKYKDNTAYVAPLNPPIPASKAPPEGPTPLIGEPRIEEREPSYYRQLAEEESRVSGVRNDEVIPPNQIALERPESPIPPRPMTPMEETRPTPRNSTPRREERREPSHLQLAEEGSRVSGVRNDEVISPNQIALERPEAAVPSSSVTEPSAIPAQRPKSQGPQR